MKSLIDLVANWLPLMVTIPFAIHSVQAQTPTPTPQIEPSQLAIQALYIFGAALLGWAARKLNAMNEVRKENKRTANLRTKISDRIDALQASHAVELKTEERRYAELKKQLEAANTLILEQEDVIEIREKALIDVTQRLKEQQSNSQLIKMVLDAFHAKEKDATEIHDFTDASS